MAAHQYLEVDARAEVCQQEPQQKRLSASSLGYPAAGAGLAPSEPEWPAERVAARTGQLSAADLAAGAAEWPAVGLRNRVLQSEFEGRAALSGPQEDLDWLACLAAPFAAMEQDYHDTPMQFDSRLVAFQFLILSFARLLLV